MFEAPETVRASIPLDDYIQPTLNHGLRVWWAYYWPTTLAVIAVCLVVGFLMGILIALRLLSPGSLNTIAVAQVYVWTALVSILSIRYILAKRFSHFQIALLPAAATGTTSPLPRTARRIIRVWWAFIWRFVVFSLIFRFTAGLVIGPIVNLLSLIGPKMAAIVPLAAQVVLDGAVGLYVMYSAILDEEFGDFRVCLMPRKAAEPVAPPVPAPSIAP
ncbi:MAG TPA: hypothetical protein VGR72_07550 [Candidatus Acidoferrales bacterium]|nr:hypothetical protein [Candidatus Acidoferrales bacterium]